MSNPASKSVRLLAMEIRLEPDVVLCRQRARQFAAVLGFTPKAQIRVATALSEIARNAFQYATGGRVEFSFETEPRPGQPARPLQSLVIVVRDSGPGIGSLEVILGGGYTSRTGLGLGIIGARRLMDRLDITTSPSGTVVTMRQILPPEAAAWEPAQVQKKVEAILGEAPASAIEEMQLQNQELIRAIDEARVREEEIQRVNDELAQTNAGVLALYDELDTLHRVSLLLASQLELRALIQSIIDVTTDLTNADIGAFYFFTEGADFWNVYATAGPKREALAGLGTTLGPNFFGPNLADAGPIRLADFEAEPTPNCATGFARLVRDHLRVRGCLVVPVATTSGHLLGAMIFAAADIGRFTERSERIVGSIATQAVVGIEKSRLFQDIKASNDAKDQFIAMLSHELRTPLNPVLAIVSSWHGDPRVPPDLREDVAVVARNIRLEARLIDDLLDFNKLINGKLQIDSSPVDLHSVIESAVEICRADFEAKSQNLEVTLAAARSTVAGDAARLQQVLWNLLKNAIKFSSRQGAIFIQTSNPAEGFLRIVVRDNGRGIEPESLTRIFGAFEQGQPQILARFGGLGLGLAIARTFVERHGGTITAASEGLGQGASFTIQLPLSDTTALQPALSALTTGGAPSGSTHARILLIEDHPDTLTTLTRLLTRKGHVVTAAPTAAAARVEFAGKTFDLIISDLGLPDCSGLELITELCSAHDTPAIALSGYGMENDVLSSKAAGFAEHLTKPIDFEHLIGMVDRLVSKSR